MKRMTCVYDSAKETNSSGLPKIFLRSKIDKPPKILIKTTNVAKSIESDIQKLRHQELMILSSSMYEKTYLQCSLERIFKVVQESNF